MVLQLNFGVGSNKYVPSSWRCSQRLPWGLRRWLTSIFFYSMVLRRVYVPSLCRNLQRPLRPLQQGRIFFRQLRGKRGVPICHPEDATAGGGSSARWAWGRSCTSLPGGPSKGLSFRPSKTDRRLKSPTNVKGQPPGPRIRRESEVVATSGVLVNRREVVGSFDISATLELHAP